MYSILLLLFIIIAQFIVSFYCEYYCQLLLLLVYHIHLYDQLQYNQSNQIMLFYFILSCSINIMNQQYVQYYLILYCLSSIQIKSKQQQSVHSYIISLQ